MWTIFLVSIWLIVFISIFVVIISPLIDKLLNETTLDFINTLLNNIEFLIGSENLNTFLILLSTTLLMIILRFAFSFINTNSER